MDYLDYVEQIKSLNFKNYQTIGNSELQHVLTTFNDNVAGGDASPKLELLYNGTANPLGRQSYDGFIQYVLGIDPSLKYTVGSQAYNLFETMKNFFKQQLNLDSPPPLGDFNDLQGLIGQIQGVNTSEQLIQFFMESSFAKFLQTFDYTHDSGGPGANGMDFFEGWARFIAGRSSIDSSSAPLINLTHYEALYFGLVLNPSATDYQQKLLSFVLDHIQKDGYFLPSQSLPDWFEQVQLTAALSANAITSVSGAKSSELRVLFNLFALLVDMVEALQKISATQGQRLTFYANFQKAFTNLLNDMPVWTRDHFVRISGDKTDKSSLFSELNSKNQSLSDALRSWRTAAGDEAKQHQTIVNQSNEVVNQQTNLASSILQQMSTILTTLFK